MRAQGARGTTGHAARAIFNLHVPPYDSGLDTAYEIDNNSLVVRNGKPHEIPVGSTAVRQILEEYQPVLSHCTGTSTNPAGRRRSGARSRSTPDPSTTVGASTA